MTTINVVEYWPFWTTPGKLRRFDYTAIDDSMPPITAVFAYDVGSKSMLYVDYDAHLNWKDTWYLKYDPRNGVMEWRDDYEGGKKVVMNPGIGWGNIQEIGGSYINYPKMDPFQSWPPAMAQGVQIVAYEELLPSFRLTNGKVYNDVLVFTYLQSWSGKPGGGARYWMAKGVGPIAVQWLAQDPTNPYSKPLIQTARMDADVSDVDPSALIS
jgi:hypothetical protein